ncbi:hypothetical protein CI109_106863 [Kwoniella shandongensis]|uniref:Copper transport protein n=1 Tax=Kwoniella shandongensis TaxID=1734106 RepID=A0A5M6C759_9TREE|nr:uncharacterized protein CI109_000881 [Kwoniella shandongensis]KAA5530701.1 hypothetical protein CI109_000881 [Kwoniella shandongensis]
MEHGGHSGHSGHTMPMPGMEHDAPSCAMNMLWNNQIADTCVVFRSWHISGPTTMILSCLIVILISLFYSYLLHYTKQYDRQIALTIYTSNTTNNSSLANRRESSIPNSRRESSLIPPVPSGYQSVVTVEGGAANRIGITRLSLLTRVTRAGLYAISVAISFWLMLVAMTYNTYLFSSIVIGAFLGHVLYEGEIDVGSVLSGGAAKGLACH